MRGPALLLAASGALILVGSGYPATASAARRVPGRLVAVEPSLVWVSPNGEHRNPPPTADVTFRLKNVGGRPVRILGVRSGCGCAKPVVSPTVVLGGSTATVQVSATTFPIGERIVPLTVVTDAPEESSIALKLTIIGTHRPPYLLRLFGNLGYFADDLSGPPREIEVIQIVGPNTPRRDPVLACDLPFLSFEPSGCERKPYTTPDTFQDIHRYRAVVVVRPEQEDFAGSLRVTDPWDRANVQTLAIVGSITRKLRVMPDRIALVTGSDGPPAGFSVLLPAGTSDVSISIPPGVPLEVDADTTRQSERLRRYLVRPAAGGGPLRPGTYGVSVSAVQDPGQRSTVHIVVR